MQDKPKKANSFHRSKNKQKAIIFESGGARARHRSKEKCITA
jgi:hypothetical protein